MYTAFFILIAACIIAYSLAPLLRRKECWLEAVDPVGAKQTLEAEKDSYLRAMKDIEFEHASNKINDNDYADLRRHYGIKAARIIRDLEQLAEAETNKKPLAMPVESQKDAQKVDASKAGLETKIAAIKEDMVTLEQERDDCIIDDDMYIAQHDVYTRKLDNILKQLAQIQG